MYPTKFDYVRASTVEEAIALLQEHEDAKFLAGGHSLIPVMKLRLASYETLIDIGRIESLKGITKYDGYFRIGSLTTHGMLVNAHELPAAIPEAASMIGDPMVRNRGTVGGNLAHADPASDLPTVFTALGATLNIRGANGERSIAANEFFTGLFETDLGENEILTSVDVPVEGTRTGSAYVKLFNPASRYAMVGACASISVNALGECKSASIAIGGLTPHAKLVSSVSNALVGKLLTEENINTAVSEVSKHLGDDVMGDIHATAEYRRKMAPIFVSRAIVAATRRAGWLAKLGKWLEEHLA
ncbi:MAG: xanthine dehydrogenase family protein subunit M [Anaerolineales bacterium]|nr:xanthine dehydrogenase family protein subunit M [Anaerolineales bacterium]